MDSSFKPANSFLVYKKLKMTMRIEILKIKEWLNRLKDSKKREGIKKNSKDEELTLSIRIKKNVRN